MLKTIVLLVSSAAAMYGCEHARVGDEQGMLNEANCLFHYSDENKDGYLSHESINAFVRNYIEEEELEERIIRDIEGDYGEHVSRDEFYSVYGYMKYH